MSLVLLFMRVFEPFGLFFLFLCRSSGFSAVFLLYFGVSILRLIVRTTRVDILFLEFRLF